MPAGEADRIRQLLETAVRISGRSRRQLERDLGLGKSYLTQLFNGRIELKVRVLLAILKEVGVDPLVFFQIAHSPRHEEPQDSAVRSKIEVMLESADRLGYSSRPPEPPPPLPNEEELERIVRRAVEEALGERATGERKGRRARAVPRPGGSPRGSPRSRS
ncbi:MAG: helix-turn-helix domain-containing protein [Thermoanaerobaculia bacterium]